MSKLTDSPGSATTKAADTSGLMLNISAVERETGLSKDVLRMWERRYGFPKPVRDENGERQYTVAEVTKLRAIKRLMDVGTRPGKIVHKVEDELIGMADQRSAPRGEAIAPILERDMLSIVRAHDAPALQRAFAGLMMRQGLQRFILETLAPLNRVVGEAWMRGELQVFEEHLYTAQLESALHVAINAFPRPFGPPTVLLTTLPGEQHGLGLLMVEALLVSEGAQCISLGVQTPLEDVRRAALAHEVDVVALSFSAAFPVRQAGEGLATLRKQLPAGTALWAGGEMTRRIRKTLHDVMLMPDLASALPAIKSWRAQAAQTERAAAT
jgi:MerR family transcriptional regulator, light-induced transcriptional regulator